MKLFDHLHNLFFIEVEEEVDSNFCFICNTIPEPVTKYCACYEFRTYRILCVKCGCSDNQANGFFKKSEPSLLYKEGYCTKCSN